MISTSTGIPLDRALDNMVSKLRRKLGNNASKPLSLAARDVIQAHLAGMPSRHFDPRKVKLAMTTDQRIGGVDVGIPGLARAYHDIDIRPTRARSLTIPIHREAYGVGKPSSQDLFLVKRNDGKAFLARNQGGDIQMMYFLTKHVHQRQDPRLMPTDDQIAESQMESLGSLLSTLNEGDLM